VSQTLAVAARELRERWLLFPAGLVLGFAPLVLPAFGLPREGAPLVGVFIALLLGLVAALVAGASMLARDTLDGRLAFLFSRPVSWPAIWGGKWLAALVLVAGSAALAILPWMLVHPPRPDGSWGTALRDPQGSSFFLLLLLLGIGLANFNATVFRSRSAWVAADLGLLLLATGLAFRWLAPLFTLRILGPYPLSGRWSLHVLLGPLAVALVVASAAQVVVGRTDIRRAHRAMSLAFWAVVFVALGAAGLRLAWARAATPADLEQYVSGAYDPSGRWLYAEGLSRRGGGAAFLIDTAEGRYIPLGLDRLWEGQLLGMTFAADGRSGVLLVDGPDFAGILSIELGADEPHFTGGELEKSPRPDFGTKLALSPTGAYLLVAHGNGASLFAAPSGRRVATATVPPGWRPVAVRFVEEGVGRVWLIPSIGRPSPPSAEMRLLEVSLDREPRTTSVTLAAPVDPVRAWPDLVRPDATGRRFLTADGGLRLRDGETGALLATLVEGSTVSPGPYFGTRALDALFLADGRILVGEAANTRTVLRVFDPGGVAQGEIVLDRVPAGLAVGPEVGSGRVALRVGPETVVVDLGEGRVVEALPDRHPLRAFWFLGGPGSTGTTTHFLVDREGAVIRRDFSTGDERVVAGPGAKVGERLRLP
jgi:hypothetical protein